MFVNDIYMSLIFKVFDVDMAQFGSGGMCLWNVAKNYKLMLKYSPNFSRGRRIILYFIKSISC
jgi:hypothetical protein